MAAIRPCCDCGHDISDRHHHARMCFTCSRRRAADKTVAFARAAVACAVRRGALPRPETRACVDCGGVARDYDHRDYSRPLEVEPVCRSCNKLRPAAKGSASLAAQAARAA